MTDHKAIELLARKLAGEATAEELVELEHLLTTHPEAVFYTELLMQVWQEGKPAAIAPSEYDWQQHKARMQPGLMPAYAPAAAANRHPRRALRMALFVVLPLVLAAGVYIIIARGSHRPAPVLAEQSHTVELYAAMGARKTARLPDGTQVWLNAGSRLRYDTNMCGAGTRNVTLSGEAFFDVAKNKEKPFVIHTGKVAIRVLGTAFNVRAYPGEHLTEATLLRGSIELTVTSRPYQKIILKPNEKFALIEDKQAVQEAPAVKAAAAGQPRPNTEKLIVQDIQPVHIADKEYVEEVSWKENEFVFQGETLEELAPKMERWFNTRIEINNKTLPAEHYTGVFHKETLEEALTGLQMIKPFKFKITNNHVLIY